MAGKFNSMKIRKLLVVILIVVFAFAACNHVKYIPRTQKNKWQDLPSIVLLDRIVDFRNEFHSWPLSKEDMVSKGTQYASAWGGFLYQGYSFKARDTNQMVFNFWNHPQDGANSKNDSRIELNSHNGWVKFYREGNVFAWKINKN